MTRFYPPLTAIAIGFVISIFSGAGSVLQGLEHQLYDSFLKLKPSTNSSEPSVIIVAMTETDIARYGFPLEDITLAKTLKEIKRQNPSAIGLDLHRNDSVGHGKTQLERIYQTTKNLIGIEKTDGGNPENISISAPPVLKKDRRTGASQLIEDSLNGMIRRGYLYVNSSKEKEPLPSLGLAVAYQHLQRSGIYPEGYGSQNSLKLGEVVFPKITIDYLDEKRCLAESDRDLPDLLSLLLHQASCISLNHLYRAEQIDGDQILINFPAAVPLIQKIAISKVLEGDIKPNLFENRMVFIGSIAETVGDYFLSPVELANDFPGNYGVEIHAAIAAQIVNAVAQTRMNVRLSSAWEQNTYILLSLLIVSAVGWYALDRQIFKQKKHTFVFLLVFAYSSIFILSSGFLAIMLGWWFPTATNLVTCLLSLSIVYVFSLRKSLNEERKRRKALQEIVLTQQRSKVFSSLSFQVAHTVRNKINSISGCTYNSILAVRELGELLDEYINLFLEEEEREEIKSSLEYLTEKLRTIDENNLIIANEIKKLYKERNDLKKVLESNSSNKLSNYFSFQVVDSINRVLENIKSKYNLQETNRRIDTIKNYNKADLQGVTIPIEIENAIENIVDNAFYYLLEKQKKSIFLDLTVTITVVKNSNTTITIKDNGIGIPLSNRQKIFTDFWTTKRETEGELGMGLGLYLAKEWIEAYRGTIEVDSVVGEYTEFKIVLPN
ncbi:CHASE2 domain-containing protein [Myxosarcina sp. GI1]|uniref:CHASE2 domain-containing protein n=1 Tax=Myxosarcina sp. GI1 TaxID=1541065 RepID=UPI00055B8F58|nr:CHASE2 domain-containing protein [Myxosarcina sp. GI1]